MINPYLKPVYTKRTHYNQLMRWLSTREVARGDKSSTVTDASFYSESWKHALYVLKVKPKKTSVHKKAIARFRELQQMHAITDCTLPSRNNPPPRETEIFWPYCPSKSFIPHYQQAHHVGYTCTSFGHHKVSLWPQSLPLDDSDSIAIPEVKHTLLITLRTNKCINKKNKKCGEKTKKYINKEIKL